MKKSEITPRHFLKSGSIIKPCEMCSIEIAKTISRCIKVKKSDIRLESENVSLLVSFLPVHISWQKYTTYWLLLLFF